MSDSDAEARGKGFALFLVLGFLLLLSGAIVNYALVDPKYIDDVLVGGGAVSFGLAWMIFFG